MRQAATHRRWYVCTNTDCGQTYVAPHFEPLCPTCSIRRSGQREEMAVWAAASLLALSILATLALVFGN